MEAVVEAIGELKLDVLDEAWVQGIFYSEFLEFGEIPSEYEEVLGSLEIRAAFRKIMKTINNWGGDQKSWAELSPHVPHQKLMTILAYHIDYGIKNVLTKEYRNNAVLTSRLYFKLLSISGYKAYHIYHSQLFTQSLACLGFPKALCDNEDNFYNTKELSHEVNSTIKELQFFVIDLRTVIETLHLNPSDMNFEDILSNLVDITGGAIVNKLDIDKFELTNISRMIYEIIDFLVLDLTREPNTAAIKLLFKCILPKLVAASVDCKNANNIVRASYVTYSGLLLTKYGKAAISAYTILLQHLCYTQDGLERAEVRQARVSLVIGLMSLLPKKSYRETVKWLLKLSTTAKIVHRHIALEMLAKLLSNDPEEKKVIEKKPNDATESSAENQTNETQAAENKEGSSEEKEGEQTIEGGKERTTEVAKDNLTTDDENSQDSQVIPHDLDQELTEEEITGLLSQRIHTVPHAEILLAFYERLNDASSTLRTRALTLLTECLSSNHKPMQDAIKELNGSAPVSRLMAAAAAGVCDERAAVRRAALSLVHRSLTVHRDVEPAATDLAILVGLCRDASIIVRSAAITALGELTSQRPSDVVFDAFLTGPVHQMSDPELKVQEQVVNLIQHLLIDRLRKYEEGADEDPLPWMFLDAVTRHNMRQHLEKACTLLNKSSNCISPRLVDKLSTHLGATEDAMRSVHCLVLLTSVAPLVDYGDIGFALDYYYKLADNETPAEPRLMPLTLELLTSWSRWARADQRATLRDHLVKRLADAHDDGNRLACAELAAHLDPLNLHWATELMQLAESRALSAGNAGVDEWLRAADLSLVAPAPPHPKLIDTFLAALNTPPPEWADSYRGVSVAGAGRLCVRSRETAALAAPVLAELLAAHTHPLVARINALLALTDICIRYTCIVEPLLGCVCDCLSLGPAELRRAAARALTRLLLAGYLRLRTPLYYRYCALLSDEDHDVREPAEYYVTCCLTPDAIYHHFVECVLHYNREDTGQEPLSFNERQLIYDVMLQRLSLVQKLNVQCRLAREVLGHAADICDEGEDLPPALNAALLDTITLLCGPRMKLPRKPQRDGDADIDDLQERVTTNIVSHKMKRTVAEVLVPAVLRLYARLRAKGGQVAAYLVKIANDLLNDYRQEIEELIEIDEELVGRVSQFQETIGQQPSFGNARNLVTSSTTHEPETPRAPRKRAAVRAARSPHRKRALRV